MPDWKATLNGSTLCGGDCTGDATVDGCLLLPPDGMGVPGRRTSDQTYPQRDGVDQFGDWYEPRIITLTGLVGGGGCGCSGDQRQNAQALTSAWSRACGEAELVLRSGCEGATELISGGDYEDGSSTIISGFNGSITLSVVTTQSHSPTHSLSMTRTGSGSAGGSWPSIVPASGQPCTPGDRVSVTGWFRAATTVRNCVVSIVFYDENNSQVSNPSTTLADTNSGWTLLEITSLVPQGAVRFIAEWAALSVAGSEIHYLDDISVTLDSAVDRELQGPFGVRGRPRVAELVWRKGKRWVADFLGRFDAIDHRLYILDADGTPGSGEICTTLEDLPVISSNTYTSTVAGNSATHHWPMDFIRLGPIGADGVRNDVQDIIGSSDLNLWNGYLFHDIIPAKTAPAILNSLGLSSIAGPADAQPAFSYPGSYTSGMAGWWQMVPEDTNAAVGTSFRVDDSGIGMVAGGAPGPTITWEGATVAMNTAVSDAFGFTDGLKGKPVFIMVTWTASELRIYVGKESSVGALLAQSVTSGIVSIPTAGTAIHLYAAAARISNFMVGANAWGTSSTNDTRAQAIRQAAFDHAEDGLLVVPDVGTECGPFTATFTYPNLAEFPVYIIGEDGGYVGIRTDDSNFAPYSLDTEDGTATRLYGQIDASASITGNPFMQISPGERLHLWADQGSIDATLCFRPSVLSA